MIKKFVRISAACLMLFAITIPMTSVYADSYDVTAKVPAVLPPNEVPVITTPDNTTVETPTIVITGTCPVVDPPLIVVLERNNQTIGSDMCSDEGTFSITISLVLGANIINVKFMTITGESSGYGVPITIMYMLPGNPGVTTNDGNSPTQTTASEGLSLIVDYDFIIYKLNQEMPITISVKGGYPPYKIFVGWGDNSSTNLVLEESDTFNIKHIYRGQTKKPSKLVVRVQDSKGTLVQEERALTSFEKIPASEVVENEKRSDIRTLTIWFLSTVAVMLLISLRHKKLLNEGSKLLKSSGRIAAYKKRSAKRKK